MSRRRLNETTRGSALVLALLVIATLSGLAIAFADSSRTEISLAAFYRDGFRARALAQAGVESALWELFADEEPDVDGPGEKWSLFDGSGCPLNSEDGALIRVRIQDESGKIQLNLLFSEGGELDEQRAAQVERLLEILGFEGVAYESLLDWMDKDDIKRMDGAESYYYQGLAPPYNASNGPLLSVEQVKLVRGFGDHEILEFATVYSDGKININTAPQAVLQCLDEDLDESLARAIINRRNEEIFDSVEKLTEVAGVGAELFNRIKGFLTVKSSLFTIICEGTYGDATATIRAVVKRDMDKGPTILYWAMV